MMMPANYSVIAENEMTYVVGGGVIANILPAIMTESNWKTFNTNLVKIVGNSFMDSFLGDTLGVMFGGSWGDGETLFGGKDEKTGEYTGTISKFFMGDKTPLNKVMGVLGGLATIYTLGTDAAKTKQGNGVVTFEL